MVMTFGSWLRSKRAQQGMTLEELAQRIGVSKRTLHYWEADIHLPYRKGLEQLLAHLPSDVEERERLMVLLTLPVARGLVARGIVEEGGARPVASAPLQLPISDLIWALRVRRGWTQEQMASAFGLCGTSVLRWEKGHTVPPDDVLYCISTNLCMSDMERKALWKMRISRYGKEISVNEELSFDMCRMHVEQMERTSILAQDPLFELYILSLRRALRRLSRNTAEATDHLIRLEIVYGCWLYFQDRTAESHETIHGVIKQIHGRYRPQPYWLPALNVASANLRRLRGPREGVQFLLGWLPCLHDVDLQAHVLADSAVSALLACDSQRANEMISIAQRMLRDDQNAATQRYVQLSAARIQLATCGDPDAWEAVMTETLSAPDRVHLLLIGAASAASAGARCATVDYLCRAEALLTGNMPGQLRRRFVELSLNH